MITGLKENPVTAQASSFLTDESHAVLEDRSPERRGPDWSPRCLVQTETCDSIPVLIKNVTRLSCAKSPVVTRMGRMGDSLPIMDTVPSNRCHISAEKRLGTAAGIEPGNTPALIHFVSQMSRQFRETQYSRIIRCFSNLGEASWKTNTNEMNMWQLKTQFKRKCGISYGKRPGRPGSCLSVGSGCRNVPPTPPHPVRGSRGLRGPPR